GTTEKVSLFCLPIDRVQPEKWKRAIPWQETGGFTFDSKYVQVREKHSDATDIIRADECVVKDDAVSIQREKPILSPNAILRTFDSLPAYLKKPRPRTQMLTRRQPGKRR
ncbi:hypothetical protein HPB47_010917, partial [Ixodes persulcatus]